jgi:hypothetical protein
MEGLWLPVVLALVSGGIGTTIVNAVVNRKKANVDITESSVKTAMSLTDSMEKRLNKIQHELDILRGYQRMCIGILDDLKADYPTLTEYEKSLKE